MAITHTLVPNQLLTADNLAGIQTITLTELSDGDTGTGFQADPANGLAIFAMSDLDNSQVTNGSTIAIFIHLYASAHLINPSLYFNAP